MIRRPHYGATLDRLEIEADDLAASAATPRPTIASHAVAGPELRTSRGAGSLYTPEPLKSFPKRPAPIIRRRVPRRAKRQVQPSTWMQRARAVFINLARHWPWS